MSATIPFANETFRPLCIKDNATATDPVEFELVAVGGVSRARLKSMIVATEGLSDARGAWSPAMQDSVIKAFAEGPGVFVEGVRGIRGLRVPLSLAAHVGIISEIPAGADPASEMPIVSGFEFSRVAGFWPILAFEIAMALARLSGQAEIDPRFFDWLSTSAGLMPAKRRGTAGPVGSRRAGNGIAGSGTVPATSRKDTSRRKSSTSPKGAAKPGA